MQLACNQVEESSRGGVFCVEMARGELTLDCE